MDLVDDLIENRYLKTTGIISAFKKIKRADFVLPEYINEAEVNAPLPIGYGQTISQPLTVAFMLELLKPKKGDKILDVGSGSGWTCALLAHIVGENGKIFGVERIIELRNFAEKNVSKYNFIKKGIVQIFCSDGYKGISGSAPFDKIIVAAAASEIPKELLSQLKIKGRLVMPIGHERSSQDIVAVDKITKDEYDVKKYPGFVFVPLVKS